MKECPTEYTNSVLEEIYTRYSAIHSIHIFVSSKKSVVLTFAKFLVIVGDVKG